MSSKLRWAVIGLCGILLTSVLLGSEYTVRNKALLIAISLSVLITCGAYVNRFNANVNGSDRD